MDFENALSRLPEPSYAIDWLEKDGEIAGANICLLWYDPEAEEPDGPNWVVDSEKGWFPKWRPHLLPMGVESYFPGEVPEEVKQLDWKPYGGTHRDFPHGYYTEEMLDQLDEEIPDTIS